MYARFIAYAAIIQQNVAYATQSIKIIAKLLSKGTSPLKKKEGERLGARLLFWLL